MRRARLIDAARLLPFLGAALLLLPDLIGSGGPDAEVAAVDWLTYLFAVWAVLIGMALGLARVFARQEDPGTDPDRE